MWHRALLLAIIVFNVAAFAAAPQTAPTTQPPTSAPSYLDQQRQSERDAQDEFNSMQPTMTLHRDAVARVFLDQGRLAVEIGGFDAPELTRINVSDSDGSWLVLAKDMRGPRAARPRPMLLLNRYDFDQNDPGAIWATYLNVNPHAISLSGESLERRTNFSETARNVVLSVKAINPSARAGSAPQTFQARTLAELRSGHPAEYRKFLLPLLGKLTDLSWTLPGTTDAYEVFGDLPADDASLGQIKSLLPALDSTAPSERTAAMNQIEAMGPRGILATMRMDLSTLTPEQQTALSDVIARGRRAKVDNAERARHDPSFLLDCLELDAPGIRPAALRALAEVIGRPLPFDQKLSGAAAEAAADALRKEILGNSATTEPDE